MAKKARVLNTEPIPEQTSEIQPLEPETITPEVEPQITENEVIVEQPTVEEEIPQPTVPEPVKKVLKAAAVAGKSAKEKAKPTPEKTPQYNTVSGSEKIRRSIGFRF